MKKTIETIMRFLAPPARIVAMLFAVCAAGSTWAEASPKATVVWNGDFGTTTKTGRDGNTYTFTLNPDGNSGENLNTLSGGTDGNVIIGSGATYGAKVSWNADNTSDTIASVIIKYSSLAVTTKNTTPVLASVSALQYQNNAATITARIDDCVAVKTAGGSKLTGRYANGSNQNYGGEVADIIEPSGYILMVFKSGSAFQFWTSSDGSTWSGGTATGLTFGSTYPTAVGLGGKSGIDSNNGQIPTGGMTIEAVAIFRGVELSTTQVANNKLFFNSAAYENWAYANEVYTWVPAKDSSDIGSSNNGTLYQFSIYSGEDTSVTYGSGGDNWRQFCIGQTQYSAPGCALRFISSSAGKTFSGGFNPFAFGGIIVESDAEGLSIGPDGSRTTVLGAASGDTETWFKIDANVSVIRTGAFCFSGNVNLDIADEKTLTLTAVSSPSIVASVTSTMATTAGGTLKMHGLGKMAVSTLFATGGATLDFSDVQESASVVRSTTPFIQGNLTIDTTTKFAFPAGLAKDTPYKLCSGTLSGPSENIADIMVGTTLKKNVPLTFSGNSVSYGDSVYAATVDGSTFTWDAEEPESLDGIKVVFAGSGTVTGLSGTGTTISTTDNVTVDVTSFTSPTLFGTGTYRWTSGYPTTIPSAEYSYEYVGGATDAEKVTVSDALTINGKLKTSGYIALTGANTLAAGGSLEVLSDKTELAAVQGVQANNWSGGLGGTITVDANAELASLTTDALTRGGSVVNINVYGTLNLGTTRWTMQSSQYHRLNLHGNAEVKGSGDGSYGILDFENANSSYVNINVYDGTPTISGPLRFRAKTITWIEANAKLAVTGGTINNGEFAKSGAGTLSFSAVAPSTSGGLSASAGTIELDNISYTAGTITLSSAQNSPTLKMIATDAATTVSAAVNVPANTRGQLAFEGAGTFALSGPNTNGSIVWLGTNPVPGTLQLNGNVTINNGAVNNNYRFNKLGSGSSTLSLSAWSTCYDKDGNPGLRYTFDTIDADAFTGTIALSNSATDSRAGCTMNFSAVNIIKSSAVYGTPLVKVTKAVGARTDSYSNAINVSATQFNGNAATFIYDDSEAGKEGIYLAAATYDGQNYKTIQAAIRAAGDDNLGDITILDATAECPDEYYVDTENGNVLTKCQAALVDTEGGTHYFATPQAAVDEIGKYLGLAGAKTYSYYEVYYGENVAIAIDTATPAHSYWSSIPLKIKCAVGASVAVTLASTESELTAGTADANGIVTYTKTDKATTYVWAGATSDSASTSEQNYARAGNWRVGTSSGATATRVPGSLDTVVFGNGAYASTTASRSVAALQVSGTVTFTGGGTLTSASAITLGTGDSITITGTLLPTPTTSVANSYVKETGDTTKTYAVDAYNTVTITGATARRTDDLGDAIKDGDTITFTLDAGEGYAVDTVNASSGEVTESDGVYSYTVTQDATITVATVSTAVTFSEVEFDYYVGYGSAKSVTATVTGKVAAGTAWTLTVGETEYAGGVYDSETGKVTWTPENGIQNLAAGQALSYSIAATGGSTGTLADQQTTVGNVVGGWIAEDAAHSGTGTWSPSAPVFGEADRAALSGETTFTARAQASGKVTLTTVVNFGNEADPTLVISADAKAAIKVENNSFKIWTKTTSEGGTGATADWLTVSGATPNLEADSTVVFTFDTDAKTFTVSVGGNALYYGASNANTSFAFASDGVAISSVAYTGAGSFTSLTGEYTTTDIAQTVDGGVVIANSFISGNETLRAMTIEEAAAALAPDAPATCSNGYNYFTCYALGLDPTKATDKPIVSVTTDAAGNYKVSVTDKDGNELKTPANVSVTSKFYKYTPNAVNPWGEAQDETLSPGDIVGEGNVGYIRAKIEINAK